MRSMAVVLWVMPCVGNVIAVVMRQTSSTHQQREIIDKYNKLKPIKEKEVE